MNHRSDPLPPRWHDLAARARQDQPPPVDTGALLHAIHRDATPAAGWWPEFAALFGGRPVFNTFAAAAFALALLFAWQTATTWDELLPWAELIAGGDAFLTGGAL